MNSGVNMYFSSQQRKFKTVFTFTKPAHAFFK